VGEACGTNGGGMLRGFWWGRLKECDYLHDLDADGKNIEMYLNEI